MSKNKHSVKEYHESKVAYYENMFEENEKAINDGRIGNVEYYQSTKKKALEGVETHRAYLEELSK